MPRSGFLTSSIGNFLRGNSDARSAAGAPAEIRVVRPENLRGRQTCCPQILAWESNVSEYQYYEFLAVDRPLDERQQAELRAVSARADITATSFVSEYHWGRFHGDPRKLMEQCFDAYLYLASWGTHQLMIRLPAQLLDLDAVRRYCVSDTINSWRHRDNVLIELRSEAGNGDRDGANETPLSEIVPIRADLAAGDYRALYIAWLLAAQSELDDDEIEPPVPPALGSLSGQLRALVDFLRIDEYLLAAAASASDLRAHEIPEVGPVNWIQNLADPDKDALLLRVIGGDPYVRCEMLQNIRKQHQDTPRSGNRTVGELLAAASARRAGRRHRRRRRSATKLLSRSVTRSLPVKSGAKPSSP
jgi:hypothetical protein